MKNSIFHRLLYIYLFIIVSIILILSLVFAGFINMNFYNLKKEQLLQESERINELVKKYGFETLSGYQTKDALDMIGYITNSSVYILRTANLEGVTLGIKDEQQSVLKDDIADVLNGQTVSDRLKTGTSGNVEIVFVGSPIFIDGKMEGAVLLFSPLNELQFALNEMYWIILIIGAAFILGATAIIFWISRKLTNPIIAMAQAAKDIAEGKFTNDIRVSGQDEIAQLGNTFTYMKNKLKNIEKMRQELISNISHELRTPLTAAKGFIQGIIDGMIEPKNQKEYLILVMEEINRMVKLVNDLLELSKLQTGSIKLFKRSVPIKTLIEGAIKEFDIECKDKNIKIIFSVANADLKVYADPDRLKQIFINLLSNAIKYTPPDGVIEISAQLVTNRVIFRVADTGIGIPEDALPHIFERFYRVDKAREASTGGSGLGLTIAKELVELHGGSIKAESTLGKGTIISFDIPSE